MSYHEYKEWIRTGQAEPEHGQNGKKLFGDGKPQPDDKQADGIEKKERDEEDGEESEEEEEDDDDDEDSIVPDEQPEDAIFIPLGLVRQCDKTYYKSSDPEWRSFVEFAVNKERNEKVRRRHLFKTSLQVEVTNYEPGELADLVGLSVKQAKAAQKLLGKDIRVGKYWIDVDYPEGPPREYERGG